MMTRAGPDFHLPRAPIASCGRKLEDNDAECPAPFVFPIEERINAAFREPLLLEVN